MSKYVLFIYKYHDQIYNYYNLGDYNDDEINIDKDVADSFKNANFDIEDYLDLAKDENYSFNYECKFGCVGYGFHIFIVPKTLEYINLKSIKYKVSYQDTYNKLLIHDNQIIHANYPQYSCDDTIILNRAKSCSFFEIEGDKFYVEFEKNIKIEDKIPTYDNFLK
jgi:hypothetical protein